MILDAAPTGASATILPRRFWIASAITATTAVGLQLVGPPWSEPLLVAIVAAYQRETAHHLKRPKD